MSTASDDAAGTGDTLLDRISERATVLHDDLRRAVGIFVRGGIDLTAPSGPDSEYELLEQLELTAADWRPFLPDEPGPLGEFAATLHARFGDRMSGCPRITEALCEPNVPWSVATPTAGAPTSLQSAFVRVELPGGATLFHDGDVGDSVFVITRGRLRVVRDDESVILAELGPNQTVGEMALLTGDPRKGTVVAVRDSVLYQLSRELFERFCLAHPSAMMHMLVSLSKRVNEPPTRGSPDAPPTNIVVIPAGVDAPAAEFAASLASFLADHVSARLMTVALLDDELGSGASTADMGTPMGIRVLDHQTELERRHDHIVFVGDDAASDWTRRCLRQADEILLVGRAGNSPQLSPTEQWISEQPEGTFRAHRRLVLLEQYDDRTPSGTAAWLARRTVEASHHVHLGRRSHFARLARFIVGKPCGLVLSGGAARALAHIGVIRALREAGISIDIVAGTSAGAVIGGQFAMGWSAEALAANNARIFGGSRRRLLDFTPPFTSLIGSSRFNDALDEVFEETHFEDLWIDFLCTTTDLTSAAQRIHTRGRLRQFVRASCSLPMVMPPVSLDGHLLVDGGIMNNVPVDPLLDVSNVGTLIVVDVTNSFYTADEAYNYDDSIPFRRVLNSRLNPFGEKLVAPGIFDVLMRSLEIGSKSLEPSQIAKADVCLRPEVSRYGYTDISFLDDIAEAGYREAVERLAECELPIIGFEDGSASR